jgi:hypothetical protein
MGEAPRRYDWNFSRNQVKPYQVYVVTRVQLTGRDTWKDKPKTGNTTARARGGNKLDVPRRIIIISRFKVL